jgi:GTP pyrophosphokinase
MQPGEERNREVEAARERLLALLGRNGTTEDERNLLARCIEFATTAHHGQLRRSGEPYIVHPIEVATLALDIGATLPMLQAALLHDTVEDTEVSLEEISRHFGREVSRLVDGCTKVARVHPGVGEAEAQAANLRKLFVTLAEDTRVIVIKLCDRLHNLRTIEHLPAEKARRIGEETLAIHAPLAHRLGLGALKSELEDRAFRAADPEEHQAIRTAILEERGLHETLLTAAQQLEEHLQTAGLTGSVSGRVKHLWSVKRKSERDGIRPQDLPDLLGLRVICESTDDCYRILAAIHELWEPDLRRLKDYINRPKFNSYQSLHTTVVTPEGRRLEVQVRTREMHHAAEHGTAAHFHYKHQSKGMDWLDRLLDWSETNADDEEFLLGVKAELNVKREILALTPKGRVITLPEGATVIDFAYAIHSDIGDSCVGARINNKIAPLSRRIENGDTVEIATGTRSGPGQEWLEWVVTAKARSKIRARLKGTKTPAPPTPAAVARAEKPKPPGTVMVAAVAGLKGSTTRIAGCCAPQPGEPLRGVALKNDISIHNSGCPTLRRVETETPGRILAVHWVENGHHVDNVRVRADARAGLLAEIAAAVTSSGGRLIETNSHGDELELSIETTPRNQSRIRQALQIVENVTLIK